MRFVRSRVVWALIGAFISAGVVATPQVIRAQAGLQIVNLGSTVNEHGVQTGVYQFSSGDGAGKVCAYFKTETQIVTAFCDGPASIGQ